MKSLLLFAESFLLEYDRQITIRSYGQKLQDALQKMNLNEDDLFAKLEGADPSGKNIQWFIKWFVNGSLLEDITSRGVDGFEKFNKLKNKGLLKPEHKDVGKLKTLDEFESLLDQYDLPQEVSTDKGSSSEVYKDEDVRIIQIKDEKAARYYGQNTKWCTAAKTNNAFDHYSEKGPIYVLLPLKPEHVGEKYQISFDEDQYMNEKDKGAKVKIKKRFKKALPFLNKLFLKSSGTEWNDSWSKSDEHIKGYKRTSVAVDMHGRDDLMHLSASHAYFYALNTIEGRWPEGEAAIAANPTYAYLYAKNVVKKRWPEGEASIAKNPFDANHYAKDIIKDRWPEAEKVIIKDPFQSYLYALNIIKDRWPEAEKVIAKSGHAAYNYTQHVVQGPWVGLNVAKEYAAKLLYPPLNLRPQ